MKKTVKYIFPIMGILLIAGGLFVNLPAGNYGWVIYDLAFGAWCIAFQHILS